MILKVSPVLLLLTLMMGPTNCARKTANIAVFENISVSFNPKNAAVFTIGISPESNGRTFDLTWDSTIKIKKELHFDINLKIFDTNEKVFNQIFAYDFDVCRIWDGFMSQSIGRMWFKNLKKCGNFPVKCPISKGYYFLKRMKVEKGSIPSVIPSGRYMYKTLMYVKRNEVRDEICEITFVLKLKL